MATKDVAFSMTIRLSTGGSNHALIVSSLREIQEAVRAQQGCRHFNLYESVEDHSSLLLVENWETQQAMNEHIRSQDFRVILAALDLSDSKPEIRFNSVVSSQGLEYLRDVLAGD